MTNIVTAPIGANKLTKTRPLYQYDYGQVLKLTGIELPTAYEVHFSNAEFRESKVQIGNSDGVTIPDEYLESGADIYAWLYLHTGADDGETVYKILIPVQKRASISPEEPTPVQQDAITQAIAALNDAVDRTAQDVEDAQQAAEDAQSAAASAHLSDLSAQQSATEAAESASEAAQSAQTATTKATQAATSASAAQTAQSAAATSAQTAQTAATAASAKADEASASATAAATKATEAATSAQGAQGSANSAAAAQTAAETAQSAAETAQAAAEIAADEVESSIEDAQDIVEAAETLMIFPAMGGAAASVATITDAANDQPMALKIGIEPVQAGSGTPSPENVRPISGWTGAKVQRSGRNLFDINGDTSLIYTDVSIQNGKIVISRLGSGATSRVYYSTVYKAGTYTFSAKSNGGVTSIRVFSPKQFAGGEYNAYYGGYFKALTNGMCTITMSEPFTIGVIGTGDVAGSYGEIYDIQLELGTAATEYEPYGNTYQVAFPAEAGTVYGGTLEIAQDGTGTLTVDKALVDLGTLAWGYDTTNAIFYAKLGVSQTAYNYSGICSNYPQNSEVVPVDKTWQNNSYVGAGFNLIIKDTSYSAAADFKTAMDGAQLVYELATPQTYTFTAEQIKSLFGTNNVWSDCGSTQITAYYADKTLLITAAEQRIENLTVSSETLPAGSQATVEKTETENGINLAFGIPKGADGQSGGVTDVQVNGTSVLNQGVANIPEASATTYGVVKTGTVSVTGTTPTITALSGIQYVCGEVSTLDITLPASGIVDVVFESGSTPTVLTINPPAGVTEVNWTDGWDEVCEANTTYELNIMNGKLGVKGTWT